MHVVDAVAVGVDAGLELGELGLVLAADVNVHGGVDVLADAWLRRRLPDDEEEADDRGDDDDDPDHRRPRRHAKAETGMSAMLGVKSSPGH
jgi:hypothetical protein